MYSERKIFLEKYKYKKTKINKEKILNLIRNNKPTKIDSNIIEFEFIDKKSNKLKILFDKNSLELKGWETKDAYSNKVTFEINNLIINNQILDNLKLL